MALFEKYFRFRYASRMEGGGGGTLIIIIDEGLLNTDDYSEFRIFLKTHFYIKAIFSLTRDTFVPVSKTQTKTSILYLIKKDDPDVTQQEPIFFAYIDKVGLNTKKKICENHLFGNEKNTLYKFLEFKQFILSSYNQGDFNLLTFKKNCLLDKIIDIQDNTYCFIREFQFLEDRLDENYNNPGFDEIDTILEKSDYIPLGNNQIMLNITSGKTPPNMPYIPDGIEGGIYFLGATQILQGIVDVASSPRIPEDYHSSKLKGSQIVKGRLLISMAGTIGRCAIYRGDEEINANQAVAIIELNESSEISPDYLEIYLNSRIGQLFFEKFQHISSQPNINLEEIKKVMIIKSVNQNEIIKVFKEKEKRIYQMKQQIIDELKDSKIEFENMLLDKN